MIIVKHKFQKEEIQTDSWLLPRMKTKLRVVVCLQENQRMKASPKLHLTLLIQPGLNWNYPFHSKLASRLVVLRPEIQHKGLVWIPLAGGDEIWKWRQRHMVPVNSVRMKDATRQPSREIMTHLNCQNSQSKRHAESGLIARLWKRKML
jgi:hypothetical protein